jgi:hypothetical protein
MHRFSRSFIPSVLISALLLAILGATPSTAVSKPSANLSLKQVGSDIHATWSFRNAKPISQSLTVKASGKLIRTSIVASKSRSYIIKGLTDGIFSVTLKSSKPNLIAERSITLMALPMPVSNIKVERSESGATLTWNSSPGSVDYYKITAVGSNGLTSEHTTSGLNSSFSLSLTPKISYTFSIQAFNLAGASRVISTRLAYENLSLRDGLKTRVFDLGAAEQVIGVGASTMRPATGSVDLDDPSQAAQNLVMSLLHNCLISSAGKRVDQATLPYLGALFAVRSTNTTLLMTSGAMGIEGVDASEWISENESIGECIQNPLTTQLHNVSTALSPLATVIKTSVAILPTTTLGSKIALASGSVILGTGDLATTEQPLQILWIGVGRGNYLSQYILISFGKTIDNDQISLLRTAITKAHSS